jgi:phosphate transport system protein
MSRICHVTVTIKLDLGARSIESIRKKKREPWVLDPQQSFTQGAAVLHSQSQNNLDQLKEKLLTMASYAEAAVNRSLKALMRRDDELARETDQNDDLIDRLEMEIDEVAFTLLARRPRPLELRLIAVAMKISQNLERVGDEATAISRRVIELAQEPQLEQAAQIPAMANLVLPMLKDALDAFVSGKVEQALAVIPRDKTADEWNRRLHQDLADVMSHRPSTISRCLNLMVISKCLERIGDHATNVAEEVVYLYEGRDIRHQEQTKPQATGAAPQPQNQRAS